MKILELFSGSESFSKLARARGHETYTVDIKDFGKTNMVGDILDIKDISFEPDMIWASPPCTAFSVASISKHWKGGKKAYEPATEYAKKSIYFVTTTMAWIMALKPKYWLIENPRGILRKLPFMIPLPRKTVWYCQYGDERAKPTDLWTNIPLEPKICKNNNPNCNHARAPRGSPTGTQGRKNSFERSKVPKKLCIEILKLIE